MVGSRHLLGKNIERARDWERGGLVRLRHGPDEAVLRQRTRRPSVSVVCFPPFVRALMVQVIRLEQREKETHIEERPHALTRPLRSTCRPCPA